MPSLSYLGSELRGTHSGLCSSVLLRMAAELTVLDFPEGSLFPSVRVCCVPCGEAGFKQTNG